MTGERTLGAILWQNFWHFDFCVFLLAGLTLAACIVCFKKNNALYRALHLTVFVPEEDALTLAQRDTAALRESDVLTLRRWATGSYQVFANLIMLFPLLGLLGTVLSLLPMVNGLGAENVQTNFFAALTSTFWGLVFAIAYKLADAVLSGRVEDNEESVRLYLSRNAAPRQTVTVGEGQ